MHHKINKSYFRPQLQQSILIYTDGSYHKKLKYGYSGFVIVNKDTVIQEFSIRIGYHYTCSTYAEMYAIYLGIIQAVNLYGPGATFKVITDCKSILKYLTSDYRSNYINSELNKLADSIKNIQANVSYKFIHSHQHGKSKHILMNNKADHLVSHLKKFYNDTEEQQFN